jgi:DNA-binding NtrC family response regulator
MQDMNPADKNLEARHSMDLKALLEAYERSLIVEALAASGGHQRRTAARLGVLPTTLHEKMKRLGLLRQRPAPMGMVPAGAPGSPSVESRA